MRQKLKAESRSSSPEATLIKASRPLLKARRAAPEGRTLEMTKKDEKIIQILSRIGEDIDSFSINDTDEWKKIHAELEKVKKDLPKNKSELTEILNLCLSGLKAISEKNTDDFLSLVSEISEGLIAS
ncbi:MAG: hypothetical protein JRE29_13740, partial [Deltaproteobacteria bacterium]|nr:hypothetical protein [Deltaproteobacteria bacterium]